MSRRSRSNISISQNQEDQDSFSSDESQLSTSLSSQDSFLNGNQTSILPTLKPHILTSSNLYIEFEQSPLIIRPNSIVRGKVFLDLTEKMDITRIKIKFRCEELASIRIGENENSDKENGDWIHEVKTTLFDTEWKLYGQESTAYMQSSWEELDPDLYIYPFALKFPNVNYPPSIYEPMGFAIRYIWSAQVDGPGLISNIKSIDYLTPYMPIIGSASDNEWIYKTTLSSDIRNPLVEVQAKLNKQIFCPNDTFKMQLNMTTLQSDVKILRVAYQLRQHHEGKLVIQQGTAIQEMTRTLQEGQINSESTQLSRTIKFDIPSDLVTPSSISRHTRTRHDLICQVSLQQSGHLFKTHPILDWSVPVSIVTEPGLPEPLGHYRTCPDGPVFFDPGLDRLAIGDSNLTEEPPNYFSLAELPPPFALGSLRQERSVAVSRRVSPKSNGLPKAFVQLGWFDEDW